MDGLWGEVLEDGVCVDKTQFPPTVAVTVDDVQGKISWWRFFESTILILK